MNNFTTTYFLPLNVHPLFIATIAYIIGILVSAPIVWCFSLLFVASIFLAWIIHCKHYANTAYTLAIISIIAGSFGGIRLYYTRAQFRTFHEQTAHGTFTAQGEIVNLEPSDNPRFDQCMTIAVKRLINEKRDSTIPMNQATTFQIYTRRTKDLCVADQVELRNLTFKHANKSSFQDYLIKEGISASLFINALEYSLVERPAYSFTRFIFYKRQSTYAALRAAMSPQTFRLFSLIFLGKRLLNKQPTERIKQHFNTWGVTHYLARSGLHMVIFALIWYMILNLLPFHQRYKHIILLFLSIIYYLLSWQSVSFCRAFIQFLLYKTCVLLFTDAHVLHILTITCLAVLLYNPMQLFFLDFQLSFGLTFALAWFNHLKNQRYKRQSHESIASASAPTL